MIIKPLFILFFTFILSVSVKAQNQTSCTGPGLNELMNIDLSTLESREVNPSFTRNLPQYDIRAYYQDMGLKVISISYTGESDKEDIKAYFQNSDDYLMTYHKQQNSAFYFEEDSVLLRTESAYFHICDGRLLAPAVGGVIDNNLYDNTQLIIDAVLKEIGAE